MAIGTTTAIGLGAAALGGAMNARAQSRRNRELRTPTGLEQWGLGQLMGGGMGGWNTGQDGGLQSMRRDPLAQSNSALQAIINAQGNPFDQTSLFEALGAMDRRALEGSVADLQASAPGLGARFGSAGRNAEAMLRAQALEQSGARNAMLGFQAHGDAQSRLLQALGLQMQGGLTQQQQQAQLLQMLLAAQGQRMGQVTPSPWGGFFGDVGSAAILPGLLGGRGGSS